MSKLALASCVVLLSIAFCSAYPSYALKEGLATGQWAPPGPGDVRGPCPGLNTLANHGFLPRNGQNITYSNLTAALTQVFHLSDIVAAFLAGQGIQQDGQDGELRLDWLDNHETIEHDASMSRSDYYFGDNHDLNATLLQGLLAASSDGNVLTEDDLAYWQSKRQNDSAARNPTYTFGFSQGTLASGEAALLLLIFGQSNEGYWNVSLAGVKQVFGLEQLPTGYAPPASSVGTLQLGALSTIIRNKWTSA